MGDIGATSTGLTKDIEGVTGDLPELEAPASGAPMALPPEKVPDVPVESGPRPVDPAPPVGAHDPAPVEVPAPTGMVNDGALQGNSHQALASSSGGVGEPASGHPHLAEAVSPDEVHGAVSPSSRSLHDSVPAARLSEAAPDSTSHDQALSPAKPGKPLPVSEVHERGSVGVEGTHEPERVDSPREPAVAEAPLESAPAESPRNAEASSTAAPYAPLSAATRGQQAPLVSPHGAEPISARLPAPTSGSPAPSAPALAHSLQPGSAAAPSAPQLRNPVFAPSSGRPSELPATHSRGPHRDGDGAPSEGHRQGRRPPQRKPQGPGDEIPDHGGEAYRGDSPSTIDGLTSEDLSALADYTGPGIGT